MILDSELVRAVQSAESRRFAWVQEQGFDTSCGYASVASLLKLYWDLETSEDNLLAQLPPVSGESFSLSLADARAMIESAGLEARGYHMSWNELERVANLHAPVLVHYQKPRQHFALLLGVEDARVVVADPARGLEVLSRQEFIERWSGAALFVGSTRIDRNAARLESAIRSALERAAVLERSASGPLGPL